MHAIPLDPWAGFGPTRLIQDDLQDLLACDAPEIAAVRPSSGSEYSWEDVHSDPFHSRNLDPSPIGTPAHQPGSTSEEDKAAAKQRKREWNRIAQAKARAKKKSQEQAVRQCYEQVSAELARAKREHELLARDNVLLERVIGVKDRYVAALEVAAPRSDAWLDTPVARAVNLGLPLGQAIGVKCSSVNLSMLVPPPVLTGSMRTEFQSLPLDRFRAMYRDGVAEITAQLEAMGPDPVFIEAPENPVWLRCIHLRKLLWQMYSYRLRDLPKMFAPLHDMHQTPSSLDYAKFLDELEFSPAQCRLAAQTHREVETALKQIREERKAIVAWMLSLRMNTSNSLIEASQQALELQRAAMLLQEGMDREETVLFNASTTLYMSIFKPYQKARFTLLCYPWLPDPTRMYTAAAERSQ
ncbi:hypothetical protein ACKKBG_A06135 [Auxenochlorella protothecoides x Auxenochlorella symbiontica]